MNQLITKLLKINSNWHSRCWYGWGNYFPFYKWVPTLEETNLNESASYVSGTNLNLPTSAGPLVAEWPLGRAGNYWNSFYISFEKDISENDFFAGTTPINNYEEACHVVSEFKKQVGNLMVASNATSVGSNRRVLTPEQAYKIAFETKKEFDQKWKDYFKEEAKRLNVVGSEN